MCRQLSPWLILLKGHPATGKSTLARELARSLHWPLIDKDDVKDHTLFMQDGNEIAYRICWKIAETQLELGLSVIVDTPLSYPLGYSTASAIASRQGVSLLLVETQLDESKWRVRFSERASRAESVHKVSSWQAMQAMLAKYDGCWQYPIDPNHHVIVDTGLAMDLQLGAVMRRLTKQPSTSSE